jgi:hypothetical protein
VFAALLGTVATTSTIKAPTTGEYQYQENKQPEKAKPEPRPILNDFSEKALNRYLKDTFAKYGLTDKIPEAEYTVFKESSWIWDNGNGVSAGLWAFIPSTWELNCKQFGKYKDLNPYRQTDCAAKMWSKGEWTQWETWCKKYGTGLKKCEWANGKPSF